MHGGTGKDTLKGGWGGDWIAGGKGKDTLKGGYGSDTYFFARGDGHDTVTIGEQTLEVRHCPGHTPGHVIFYHEPSQLAAVGDVLFQGSIGRSDFPRGNYDQLVESIVTQLWPLGDEVTFIPGHGPLSTFGRERKTNPFVSDLALGRA